MTDEEVSKEEIEQMEDIITRIKREQNMEKSTSPVRYQFIINLSTRLTSFVKLSQQRFAKSEMDSTGIVTLRVGLIIKLLGVQCIYKSNILTVSPS